MPAAATPRPSSPSCAWVRARAAPPPPCPACCRQRVLMPRGSCTRGTACTGVSTRKLGWEPGRLGGTAAGSFGSNAICCMCCVMQATPTSKQLAQQHPRNTLATPSQHHPRPSSSLARGGKYVLGAGATGSSGFITSSALMFMSSSKVLPPVSAAPALPPALKFRSSGAGTCWVRVSSSRLRASSYSLAVSSSSVFYPFHTHALHTRHDRAHVLNGQYGCHISHARMRHPMAQRQSRLDRAIGVFEIRSALGRLTG